KNSINSLIFQLILQKGQPRDILDLRIMFEPPYTLMAMERATPEDIEKIAETVYSFETAIKEKRQKADHDLAFHLAILQSTRNPFVILIGETIYQLFYTSLAKFLQTNPHDALACHKEIFAAFYEKDSEKLQKEIINSFKFWKTAL
ncbi:FadR/GntR family transcriptional regulator, partial [Thermodesulfobacteriota bacterium]